MSYKRVEMFEFDCDGHCGEKKTAAVREIPNGWVEVNMSPRAVSTVSTSGEATRHFCPTCFSLMTLPLWSHTRQFQILSLLTEDELDDWNLEGLFDKLKAIEKKRLQQEMSGK